MHENDLNSKLKSSINRLEEIRGATIDEGLTKEQLAQINEADSLLAQVDTSVDASQDEIQNSQRALVDADSIIEQLESAFRT